jgi:hypothetical protein
MDSVLPISEVKRSVRVAASRVLMPRPSKSRTARVVLVSWAFIFERVRIKANIGRKCFIVKITKNYTRIPVALLSNKVALSYLQ